MRAPLVGGARRGPDAVANGLRLLLGALTLLLAGWLIVAGATGAAAHAQLLSTTPEDGATLASPPAQVELHFNEPVQLLDGSVRLVVSGEEPLTLDAQAVDADIRAEWPAGVGEGHYTLSYRVVSADGHPIAGAITFTIGEAPVSDGPSDPSGAIDSGGDPATRVALVVLTAMQYVGLLMLAGLRFFERIVLRGELPATTRAGLVRRSAAILAAAASLLLVPVAALHVLGAPLHQLVAPSTWWPGVLWPPVAVAAIVLVGAGVAALVPPGTASRSSRLLADIAVLAALGVPILVGHTMTFEPRALVIAGDAGHLLAGAFWLGGLTGLLLHLADGRRRVRTAAADAAAASDGVGVAGVVGDAGVAGVAAVDGVAGVAGVANRFSRYALWSVLLLAASGVAMGVVTVGSIHTLVTSGYGLALLVKLGVIAPIVALAGYNRYRLVPALAAAPPGARSWRTLTRTLTCEAALLIVVLAVTGVLTNLSPGHDGHDASEARDAGGSSAPAEAVEFAEGAQRLDVEGSLAPGHTGENEMSFTLRYEGEPITPEEVTIRARMPEYDLGPFEVLPGLDEGTGAYTAALTLPLAGDWDLQILARVSDFAEPIVTIPVTVGH